MRAALSVQFLKKLLKDFVNFKNTIFNSVVISKVVFSKVVFSKVVFSKMSLAFALPIAMSTPILAQTSEPHGGPVEVSGQPIQYDSSSIVEDTGDSVETMSADEPTRFSIFKPNFVMWSVPRNRKDEQGLQIRLSAKYSFLTCSNTSKRSNFMSQNTCAIFNIEPLRNTLGTFNIFFSYTTDFI